MNRYSSIPNEQKMYKKVQNELVRLKAKKIDTILTFGNHYMVNSKIESERNVNYIIYKEEGKVWVDRFYFVSRNKSYKIKYSNKKIFADGNKVFSYFFENRIDTIKTVLSPIQAFIADDPSYYAIDFIFKENNYKYSINDYQATHNKRSSLVLFPEFILQMLKSDGLCSEYEYHP
ncbi:MAG TPA: hypothetical protein VK806_09580 [Bacteroidia bacterium]|nr:hypothetical protein [Bacteroidia bacterium]